MRVFVSYTAADERWAEWIAWELERAGHTAVIQAWDFGAGDDFVRKMQAAVAADRVVAVLSSEYLASPFCEAEWMTAFRRDPNGVEGVLVPVRVASVAPPGLLGSRVYVDLVDEDEATCRALLREALPMAAGSVPAAAERPPGPRPERAPRFPGPPPHTALDLALELGRDDGGQLVVRARAPDGAEASAVVRLSDGAALHDQLPRVEDAVLASSAVVRRGSPRSDQPVQDLGRQLFDALVTDDVRSLLHASRQAAWARGTRLRLVLGPLPEELAALPWELLYDPAEEEYLCLTTPLIRSSQVHQRRPFVVDPPLRVLGMVVTPRGQAALEGEVEQQHLEDTFAPLVASGAVELHWLGPTWRDLQRALQQGPWHVLHFVGHGGVDLASGEGTIVVADDRGRSHPIGARDLANLLRVHEPLRLVVLNACATGRGTTTDPASSVAATLARRGIPAVVAMQFEVTDVAAIEFTRSFYGALTNQLPVDLAATQARQAISLAIPGTFEWATPVLHLQVSDGYIFDLSDAPAINTGVVPAVAAPDDRGAPPVATDQIAARYAEGVDAAEHGHWGDAVKRFGEVVAEDRGYRDGVLQLEAAWRQERLAHRFAAAEAAADAGDWSACVHELEALQLLGADGPEVVERLAEARRALELEDEAPGAEGGATLGNRRSGPEVQETVADPPSELDEPTVGEEDRDDRDDRDDRRPTDTDDRRPDADDRRSDGGDDDHRHLTILTASLLAVVVVLGGWLLARQGGDDGGGGGGGGSFDDDFDGGVIDPARWAPATTGTAQGDVSQGGDLRFQVVTDDGAGEVYVQSTCGLVGDFDVRVSYVLEEWPAANGGRVGIVVTDEGGEDGGAVMRLSQTVGGEPPGEHHAVQIGDGPPVFEPTADRAGQLRLTRDGDRVSGFVRIDRGDEWSQVGAAASGGAADLRLQVWGATEPVVVTMDDFAIDADACG